MTKPTVLPLPTIGSCAVVVLSVLCWRRLRGFGEKRRKALLKHFGSLKAIQAASLDELRAMPGLPAGLAERLYAAFQERKSS